MASLAFDTLDFSRRLKAGGFSAEQAETMADALKSGAMAELATKADLAELRRDLTRDMAEMKADTDAKLRDLENRLVIKLGALVAGVAALLFAALKLSA